jgi:N-formylglutamate amidohydrolase
MKFSGPSSQTPPPPSPVERLEPTGPLTPLVFASPHSGAYYPREFVDGSPLELAALRKSEDCYVDELFSDVPDLGAPLLRALYPRAYVDVNREPYELDPEMFDRPLPSFVNTTSARVAAGLGTIARVVGTRREIYRGKLSFAEAERRINGVHKPYHQALRGMVARARSTFGFAILIDCHSMPSSGLPMDPDGEVRQVDVVLGDRTGLSCHASLSDVVAQQLGAMGYNVIRNNPYAGGYTTQHYGDPANGVHALQIEINRNLYMDESTLQRRAAFSKLRSDLRQLTRRLIAYAAERTDDLRYQRLSAE